MPTKAKAVLEDVKESIRADHSAIRSLLDAIERLTSVSVGCGDASMARAFTDEVWKLRLTFDEHLAREERELFPYVEDLEGTCRVTQLMEDHRHQRTLLLAMVNACETDEKGLSIAAELKSFTTTIRQDMHDEEREVENLSEVGFVADQSTG
jgi:DUF438 domain-containing protein